MIGSEYRRWSGHDLVALGALAPRAAGPASMPSRACRLKSRGIAHARADVRARDERGGGDAPLTPRRTPKDAMDPLKDVDTRDLVARARAGDQQAWVATDRPLHQPVVVGGPRHAAEPGRRGRRRPDHLAASGGAAGQRCASPSIWGRGSSRPRGGSAWPRSVAAPGSAWACPKRGRGRARRRAIRWTRRCCARSGTRRCGGRSARSRPAASRSCGCSWPTRRPATTRCPAALDMPVGSIGPTRQRCLQVAARDHVGRDGSPQPSS